MQKFSLKALGAAILTLGLVVAGAALPASAATITPAITPTSFTSGITNSTAVTITAQPSVAAANQSTVQIELPSGWSFISAGTCASLGITYSPSLGVVQCTAYNTSPSKILVMYSSTQLGTSVFSLTIPPNKINVESGNQFTLQFGNMLSTVTVIDTGVVNVSVSGGSSAATVTFNSNGGSGAMADQSASAATALSANAFTRSGYTFAGWNTAADGSGTAYADGDSFPFSANATLYAQWTATLATTGFDAAPYLFGGLALALTGGALVLIARRKQSN